MVIVPALASSPPHAPPASELTLERARDLASLRPAWSELAARSGNLFATPEWLDLWWRHFGRGTREVWVARDGHRVRALLPLYLHGGTLRFAGHGPGDELGPVSAPEDRDAAAAALGTLLDGDSLDWDTFVGDDLPAHVDWAVATGAAVTRRTASPELRLDSAVWDDFLASRSAGLRRQLRRCERRLAARHSPVFRVANDPRRLPADIDALFALHVARWGPDDSHELTVRAGAFQRDFAAAALERGWLRLHFLELDGHPAAALLNFRFGGAEWFYQGGRDPEADSLSPGFLLHAHAIRGALEDGLRAYRFLRGDEPYKRRLATHDNGLVTVRRAREST
jgi:CelD/BcsL family acetyltransferase involved in cellulose biosynthesis